MPPLVVLTFGLTVVAAALGWVSYAHVVVLIWIDLLAAGWFARQRTVAALGPVGRSGLKYASYGVPNREDRELHTVAGQPLTLDDRKFVAEGVTLFHLAAAGMSVFIVLMSQGDTLLVQGKEVLVWATLAATAVHAERRDHQRWMSEHRYVTADPTVQGDRGVTASVLTMFVVFFTSCLGPNAFTALLLTVAAFWIDRWHRLPQVRERESQPPFTPTPSPSSPTVAWDAPPPTPSTPSPDEAEPPTLGT